MASGPFHFKEAERLLRQAARWENNIVDDLDSYASIDSARTAAQAHATLALTAATALGGLSSGDWQEAILREKRSES